MAPWGMPTKISTSRSAKTKPTSRWITQGYRRPDRPRSGRRCTAQQMIEHESIDHATSNCTSTPRRTSRFLQHRRVRDRPTRLNLRSPMVGPATAAAYASRCRPPARLPATSRTIEGASGAGWRSTRAASRAGSRPPTRASTLNLTSVRNLLAVSRRRSRASALAWLAWSTLDGTASTTRHP